MSEFETILLERKGRVGLITLNRPKALNALNSQVLDEMIVALDDLESDRGIGAIVITGSERAFAAGADIKEMQPQSYIDVFMSDFFARWDRLAAVPGASRRSRRCPAMRSAVAASSRCCATF